MLLNNAKYSLESIFNAFSLIVTSDVSRVTTVDLGFDFGPVSGADMVQYATRTGQITHRQDAKRNVDSITFSIKTPSSPEHDGHLVALREVSFKRDDKGQATKIQFIEHTPDGSKRNKGVKGLDDFLAKTREYLDHFQEVAKDDPIKLGKRAHDIPAGAPISYSLPRQSNTNFWKDPNVRTPIC